MYNEQQGAERQTVPPQAVSSPAETLPISADLQIQSQPEEKISSRNPVF